MSSGTDPSAQRFDFSNPFISAAIIYGDKRFPLWMKLPKDRLTNLTHGFPVPGEELRARLADGA